MATTNTELKQKVQAFQRLSVNDRIAALGALYSQASSSLSSSSVSASDSENVQMLLDALGDAYSDDPALFLHDVLMEKQDGVAEVALDPHPSKAMVELLPGSSKPPLKRYNDLSAHDRMAFWYLFAQRFGDRIPSSYQPSEEAQQFIQSLGGLDMQQQTEFLSEIL
ncbi:hypothetical protein H6F67_08990 [Microcoleus sp. FACHB-1515]|uniref:orange carotenoid protein N-terminal domain-containing protein n=1 Tax=Cyanophyceae TaxID=3028117 RepID=UPI001682F6FB|nr:orange carotenoid protein N-terminal domain-containing protein [Microcoleus sp. FACHB-1515]MBD2089986.1 hypothetical protein [Microcoleus sp. FACHB-1515]